MTRSDPTIRLYPLGDAASEVVQTRCGNNYEFKIYNVYLYSFKIIIFIVILSCIIRIKSFSAKQRGILKAKNLGKRV